MAKARDKKKTAKAPMPGIVAVPRDQDFGQYFATNLTPERAKRTLRAAAHGDPFEQEALFDEMLETDDHLASVYSTRTMALTGLDWEILSATQAGKNRAQIDKRDENLAGEVADFVRGVFSSIRGLAECRDHSADAIGRGTTVTEDAWETRGNHRIPVELIPVRGSQLVTDINAPTVLRILTKDEPHRGVAIDDFAPGKFIVHTPRAIGGSRFRGGLLRVAVPGIMSKRHTKKSWWFGIEAFGLPISVATYDAIDPQTKTEILTMLKSLGVGRGGLFPKGCEFQFHEFNAKGGEWPHERLLAYVDAGNSKLMLGQTLTTQNDKGGSNAMAMTHDEVRGDIRDDDARKFEATINEQLIRPMVELNFGEDGLRVLPSMHLITEEARDIAIERINIVTAVRTLRMPVPMRHAVETLGVPVVEGTDLDAAIPIPPESAGGFGGDTLAVTNRAALRPGAVVSANKAATKTDDIRGTLTQWSKAAASFEARSESNINRLIDRMAEELAALPDDATADDAAMVIAAVMPEVGGDELEELFAALNEASLLAGAATAEGAA